MRRLLANHGFSSGYDFVSFFPAGVVGECTSSLTPGQFVRYATFISGSWRTQSSTVLVPSVVYGIPVNGWLFPATDGVPRTVPPIPTNTGSTSSGTPAATGLLVSGGLPESARIGIGVGVPLGLIFLGLLVAAVALWNRKRKREQQEDSDGHHSSEKPAGSGIGAGLFGGRGGGDQFPPATASTFGGRKSSHVQSPSPVTRGRTRERTSRSRSSQRIIGTAGSAGAGLVSGWRSLAGSVTSPKSPGGVSSFTGGTDDDPAGFKMPAYAYPTYEVRDMPPVEEYAASGAGAAASTSDGRRNSDGSGGPAEGSGARERLVPR